VRDSELWGEEGLGVMEREGRAPCFADAAKSKNVDGSVEMFGYERPQFLGKIRPIHSLTHILPTKKNKKSTGTVHLYPRYPCHWCLVFPTSVFGNRGWEGKGKGRVERF